MYCANCGKELIDGNKFCPNCGTAVQAQPVEQQKKETPKPVEVKEEKNKKIAELKEKVKKSFCSLRSNTLNLYKRTIQKIKTNTVLKVSLIWFVILIVSILCVVLILKNANNEKNIDSNNFVSGNSENFIDKSFLIDDGGNSKVYDTDISDVNENNLDDTVSVNMEVPWYFEKGSLYINIDGEMESMEDWDENNVPWSKYKNAIYEVVISDGCTSIGNNSFAYCKYLSEISIPNSVTNIGENAFSFCSNLEKIEIPDSVTAIGKYAFYFSGITAIIIPDSVTEIKSNTFEYCKKLSSVTIPDSVSKIDIYAFDACPKLESVTIPGISNGTEIDQYAFDKHIVLVYRGI